MKKDHITCNPYLPWRIAYFALLSISFCSAMEPEIKSSEISGITLTIINDTSQNYSLSNHAINQIIPKKTTQKIPLTSLFHTTDLYLQLTTKDSHNPKTNGILFNVRSINDNERIFSASLAQGDSKAKDAELSFNPTLDKPDINVTVNLEDNNTTLTLTSSYELSILETQGYKLKKLPYLLDITLNNNTNKDYITFFEEGSQQIDIRWLNPHTQIKRNFNEYLKNTRSNTLENTLYIAEATRNNPKKWALHVLSKISRTPEGLYATLHITLDNNFGSSLIEKYFSFPIIPRVSEWNINCTITNDTKNPLQIKLISQITQKELS
jgi:hypothetical protein